MTTTRRSFIARALAAVCALPILSFSGRQTYVHRSIVRAHGIGDKARAIGEYGMPAGAPPALRAGWRWLCTAMHAEQIADSEYSVCETWTAVFVPPKLEAAEVFKVCFTPSNLVFGHVPELVGLPVKGAPWDTFRIRVRSRPDNFLMVYCRTLRGTRVFYAGHDKDYGCLTLEIEHAANKA